MGYTPPPFGAGFSFPNGWNLPLQPQIQPSVLHLKQPRVPNPSSQSSQSFHTWEPEAEFIPTPSHGNSSSRQNLHYAACNYQYKRNKTIWWNVRKILPLSHPDRQEESPNLYANGQLEAFLGNCKEVMPLCKSEGEKKRGETGNLVWTPLVYKAAIKIYVFEGYTNKFMLLFLSRLPKLCISAVPG